MAKKGKTRKAFVKRFVVKKSGKVIHRTGGQDHFNAREPGKVTRQKRNDKTLTKTITKTIKRAIAR